MIVAIASEPRPAATGTDLLRSGDHMDQKTFHALYLQTPEGFKAELIGGIVYVALPTSARHGRLHLRLAHWLGAYNDETPGTDALDNTTNILSDDSEPQPDLCLRLEEGVGGHSKEGEDECIAGPAELVVEIAYSSVNIDLHAKRRDYETAGVKEYLIALVDAREVVWFGRNRKGFAALKPGDDGVLRSKVFPGLWLDPAGVFEKTSRRLLAALRAGLASAEHAAFVAKLEARQAAAAKRKPKPQE